MDNYQVRKNVRITIKLIVFLIACLIFLAMTQPHARCLDNPRQAHTQACQAIQDMLP